MNGVREVYIFDHINGTVGRVPIEGIAWVERSKLDAAPRYEALRTMVDSRIEDMHRIAERLEHGDPEPYEIAGDVREIAEDLERAIGRPLTEPESPDA